MTGRYTLIVLATLLATLQHPAWGSPDAVKAERPDTRSAAPFPSLLAAYRSAALNADDATARSLEARTRAERARAEVAVLRRAFGAAVARAYIDGPAVVVEAVLHARTYADLHVLMPFVEANLALRIGDARALSARRDRAERLAGDADRAGRAAVAHERRMRAVAEAIAARLASAEAAVRAAERAAEAARARARLEGLTAAWSTTKKTVNMALYYKRKARGEKMFRDAAPFLGPRPDCTAPKGLRPAGMSLGGKASWYGAEFAGKGTASGAVYDPWRYTVAHRSLPFGLFLLIKSDGKCVMSLLNDRGPYIYDRILDLSAASARAVDLSGVERVDAVVFVRDGD